jgi:hypothetical protein
VANWGARRRRRGLLASDGAVGASGARGARFHVLSLSGALAFALALPYFKVSIEE